MKKLIIALISIVFGAIVGKVVITHNVQRARWEYANRLARIYVASMVETVHLLTDGKVPSDVLEILYGVREL